MNVVVLGKFVRKRLVVRRDLLGESKRSVQ